VPPDATEDSSGDADEDPSELEHWYCKMTSRISDSGKLNSLHAWLIMNDTSPVRHA